MVKASLLRQDIKRALNASLQLSERASTINGPSAEKYIGDLSSIEKKIRTNAVSKRSKLLGDIEIHFSDYVGKRVRVNSVISEVSDEVFVLLGDAEDDNAHSWPVITARINAFGTEISTVAIESKSLIQYLKKYRGQRVRVFGTVVLVPIKQNQSEARLYVDKVEALQSMVDVLAPPKDILKRANGLLKEKKGELLSFLSEEIIRLRKIVTGHSDQFNKAIIAAVVAAVAEPYLGGRNGRHHTLYIGPPGSGKWVLARVHELLNPIFYRIEGGKNSVAGILAASKQDRRTGKWRSEGGYLALGHRGTIYIEDIHMSVGATLDKVFEVLSPQMESGKVTDSTAAKTIHEAATGCLLDLNLMSQVDKTKSYLPHEEMPIPGNILSRLDYIFDLKESVAKDQSQINSMVEVHFRPHTEILEGEALLLKTIVALLIDLHKKIDLSPIVKVIQDSLKAFHKENVDLVDDSVDFNSNYNRMFKSAAKMATAHARLHQRDIATQEDAEFALEMLCTKFKALKRLMPTVKASRLTSAKRRGKRKRHLWIIQKFGGCVVTIGEVFKSYSEDHVTVWSEKTFERDIKEIGVPSGEKWKIPRA